MKTKRMIRLCALFLLAAFALFPLSAFLCHVHTDCHESSCTVCLLLWQSFFGFNALTAVFLFRFARAKAGTGGLFFLSRPAGRISTPVSRGDKITS
ncbi:MAG: hypothetical protein MJ078_01340 [Clostridia bacterium]|nr:hypothetical protein [Clostridia bacterium]